MPVLGSRGQLRPELLRRAAARPAPVLRPVPAYHGPLVYAPRPRGPAFHAGIPSSHPFAGAVQQANRRVSGLPQPQAPRPSPQRAQENTRLAEALRTSSAGVALRALEGRAKTLGVPMDVVTPKRGELPGGWIRTPQTLAQVIREVGQHEAFQRRGYEQLAREAKQRSEHAGDVSLAGATINPAKLVEGASSLNPVQGGGILGKLINEAADLPGQTILSGAVLGEGLRKGIAKGDWRVLGKEGKGALDAFTHPLETAQQSPLATALMLAGGEAAVGGVIGTSGRVLARAGMLPAETFSRVAPDVALYGEGDLVPAGEGEGFVHGQLAGKEGIRVSGRRYSRDPVRAAIQQLYEKHAYEGRTLPSGERVLQASGRQLQRHVAGGLFKVGSVDIAKGAEQRSRVATVRGTVNRVMQKQKVKGGELVGVRPKLGADAVSMIAENAVRGPEHFKADLELELSKLREARKATDASGNPKLAGPQRAANKNNIDLVEGLLGDSKLQQHVAEHGLDSEPYRAAARIRQVKAPLEAMLVHGGKLLPEQMRAALFSYAINHMGAKFHTEPMLEAAEKASAARGESPLRQAEVGGRDLEGVRAHHETKAALDEHGERLAAAETAHARARTRYDRLAGQQASARARGGGGPRSSTAAERAAMDSARAAREDARQAVKAAAKQHEQAKIDHEASPLPARKTGVKGRYGEPLTTQTIHDHMAEAGLPKPTYVSHVMGVSGRGSYYRSVARQPSLENFRRTGEAHAQGLNDKSWAGLVGTAAKQSSEVAQLELRRRFLNRFSLDRFRTQKEAQHAISNFSHDPEGRVIPESEGLGPLRAVHLGSGQIVGSEGFQEAVNPASVKDALEQFGLAQHAPANSDELGHFAVIPSHVHDRYLAHDEAMEAGKLGAEQTRAMQAYARAWRRAKLNTSAPHVFGVVQEQAIRVLAEQVGGMAWYTGRKYDRSLKRLAEVDHTGFMAENAGPLGEHFRALESVMGGRGAIASSGRWQDTVRKAEQFQETSRAGVLTRAGGRLIDSKAAVPIRATWNGWSHLIEGGLLRSVEEAAHHAHMGKALRETGVIDSYRSVLKAQGDTMEAMIRNRLTPNLADATARKVMDMYGNWQSQTPRVRSFVSKWAPFGLWYLNSLRWLYRLPLTHPVKAAVLAAMYQATKPRRESEGQGIGSPKAVPGFLQGAIDPQKTLGVPVPFMGAGTKVLPTYYSPMGAFGAEAPLTAAQQLAPYLASPIANLFGVNALTREKLKGPHGEELSPAQIAENAAVEGLAGPIPLSTQLQTGLQGGGKPYGTANLLSSALAKAGLGPATVKPGTEHSLEETIGKMFEPTRTIRKRATTGRATDPILEQLREARGAAAGGSAREAHQKIAEELRAARRRK